MTTAQWQAFAAFRQEFREKVREWSGFSGALRQLQLESAEKDTPPYPLETGIVYNRALDDITQNDEIRLLVIGDNPGKDEQLAKNNRYLVGQAGKIADGFFRRNPEFGVDFRRNVIILNKTPVHTAKTAHLKYVIKNGGTEIRELIERSQIWMAQKTAELHSALAAGADPADAGRRTELWLVGYAELKKKGIFTLYRDTLQDAYSAANGDGAWNDVYVFQHFSMNRFSIDLREFREKHPELPLTDAVHALGTIHKNEIYNSREK
ncbi:MAG: hypothetical protein K2H09_03230 [Treponemataceae bacterium]|nr:hypothetical protein [Treponemataceae bacterium]